MAASSSATAAQSLLNCSISDPSPAHQDKVAVALGRQQRGLRVPELRIGLRGSQQRRSSSSSVVRAAAVETVEEKVEAAVVEKSVNTIRFLAIGAVEKANSGHPGLPMGTPSCISLDMTVSRKKT